MSGPVVHLPEDLREKIISHCVASLPNEGCGMLAMDGDRVVKVYPTANDEASPVSYTIPPQELYDSLIDSESNGWRVGGVFHSHPHGPAQMSATDLTRVTEPDWIYLVISLADDVPVLAAWRDGSTVEV